MPHACRDHSGRRHGVVLLVVISLLTLFAVIGLSFVLYANATAEGARLSREAQSERRPNVDPELLFSYFLGQLLYDAADDVTGVYSGLRGHSLARSMFGLRHTPGQLPEDIARDNAVPYCGTGRMRIPTSHPALGRLNDYHLVNYTYFPKDGLLRDPERPAPRQAGGSSSPDPLQWPPTPFLGGYNAPYTYPDLNNIFLAAVRADGAVMLPSFHRPWTGFGDLWTFNADKPQPNPNWFDENNKALKYLVLRPRPAEHAGFPPPEDPGGDVKNLIGYPGMLLPNGRFANNDSIWLDLDAPVMPAPDGRKYKALFAPLIIDLDSRINLNVHGHTRRPPNLTSNQGWGPWEVNPAHLSGSMLTGEVAPEWANMVTGTTAPPRLGRKGANGYGAAPAGPVGRGRAPLRSGHPGGAGGPGSRADRRMGD